jgi:hypothetical protein
MPAPKENTPGVQSVPSAVNVMRSPRRMLKVPVPMDDEDFRDRIYRMERELNAIIRANRAYFRQQRHSGKRGMLTFLLPLALALRSFGLLRHLGGLMQQTSLPRATGTQRKPRPG